MARSSTKEKTGSKVNVTEAMSNVYDTKDVLVSSLTTNVLEELTKQEVRIDNNTARNLQQQINGTVTVQMNGLVDRLLKALEGTNG